MSNANETGDKLGHDPLEWLEAESTSEAAEQDQQAPTPTPASDPEVESHDQSPSVELPTSDQADTISDTPPPTTDSGITEFGLPAAMTVQHIEAIHSELLAIFNAEQRAAALHLNGADVETLDTSGYQLLLSVVKTCEADSVECKILKASEKMLSQLDKLGDQVIGEYMENS